MPNRDTHYDLTALLVATMVEDATIEFVEDVAWASQMVDTCTTAWVGQNHRAYTVGAFPTQCYSYDFWAKRRVAMDPRVVIWTTFHFPYGGNLGDARAHMVATDLSLLARLLSGPERDPIKAGIMLHRMFDGLTAHQWFRGWRDERNRSKGRNGKLKSWFVSFAAPPIGHAEYNGDIDAIDCPRWIAPNGDVVDNHALWLAAMATISSISPNNALIGRLMKVIIDSYSNRETRLSAIEDAIEARFGDGVRLQSFRENHRDPLAFLGAAREMLRVHL